MRKRKQAPLLLSAETCKELTELISDYVAGQLKPSLKREFEQHLSICPDCVNFLNSYKKTIAVTGALEPTALPVKVRNNVLEFLRKKMRRIATFLFCLASQFSG
jgi:anti-sigma factor RsiW